MLQDMLSMKDPGAIKKGGLMALLFLFRKCLFCVISGDQPENTHDKYEQIRVHRMPYAVKNVHFHHKAGKV